ncbi:LysR family transcriptional regulator [Verticiella sediminum]|uniref:LysR family transcriptional regulator n=1 Tax=Verticiella sediminum TaxID=1247510 RepID=A0A556AAZ4_9BURK|nr:LysR substrate-binding domain-containing protein [Verticiella sediminum]TSH90048.1 LysR family transcriptional regulator [Verticiella sediminum]
MRQLDIASLELLVLAIEESSLSKAAKQENQVASAASKRISMLESRVGTALLERRRHGVRPTAAGLMLYQHAKAILRSVQVAEDALGAYNQFGNATIRLAANPSTTLQWLPDVMSGFTREHPGLNVDLIEALSQNIPVMVSEGRADMGIYHARHPNPGVTSYAYRRDRIGLVTPQWHPLAQRAAIRLEDALEYEFLGYFPLHTLEAFMALAGSTISRPPTVKTQVANLEARCRMVREGLGLAIVPENVVRTYLRPLSLTLVPLIDEWAERCFFICVRDAAVLSEPAARMLRYLRESCTADTSQLAEER